MTLPLSQPTLLLWAVAGVVLAWRCLPAVLGILGFARVHIWGEECPAAAEPPPDDAQFQLVAGQLRAAGLVPVGPGVERGWLFGLHWWRTYRKWFYATPERDCYVSLSRRSPDDPLRAAFMTALTDGTLVESVNRLEWLVVRERDYVRWGYATQFLGELLDLHRQAVEKVRVEARVAVARHDLATFLALLGRHGQRQLAKVAPQACGVNFLLVALAVGAPAAWADYLFGHWHWAVPLTVLAGGLAHATFVPFLVKRSARRAAQKDALALATRRGTGLGGADRPPELPLARLGITCATKRAGEASFRAPDEAFQGR